MRTLLFLVHGVGMRAVTPAAGQSAVDLMKTWYSDPVKTLRGLDATHGYNLGVAFDVDPAADPAGLGKDPATGTRRVTVIPVTYCDTIHARLEQLGTTGDELVDALALAGTHVDQDIAGALRGKSASDAGFFWTHGMDVVLTRLDMEVRNRVHLSVAKQISDAWQRNFEGGAAPTLHTVTHSLGTFICPDSIHAAMEVGAAGGLPAFSSQSFRLRSHFALANVSRIMSPALDDPYRWSMRPLDVRPGESPKGVIEAFFDARQQLDPIPAPLPFDPPKWNSPGGYAAIKTTALRSVNVHGYSHYLADPRVHTWLLNRLVLGQGEISDAKISAEVQAYDDDSTGSPCLDVILELKQKLGALPPLPSDAGAFLAWAKRIAEVAGLIQQARERCASGFAV